MILRCLATGRSAGMAAFVRCCSGTAARQPPACAPSCSYTAPLAHHSRSAAAHVQRQWRSLGGRRSLSVRADPAQEKYMQQLDEEENANDAAEEAEWEKQYEAIRAQGPPRGMSQEAFDAQLEQYKKTMEDPKMRAQIMEQQRRLVENPELAQQMQEMTAVMQNEKLMSRMAELKGPEMIERFRDLQQGDPDMAPFFEDMQKNGMQALQKYMSDPTFLTMLGEKLGDIDMSGTSAAAGQPAPQAPPEIENLLQAARYGDLEATEDLIAVGNDVNAADPEGRTPLHYAVAYVQKPILEELLGAGANLEAVDSKGNTPLHYAAGYGRGEFVTRLLEAGANGKATNASNHTPHDLVTIEQRNPLNQEAAVLEALKSAAA